MFTTIKPHYTTWTSEVLGDTRTSGAPGEDLDKVLEDPEKKNGGRPVPSQATSHGQGFAEGAGSGCDEVLSLISDYPFLKYSFFNALEKSGCIGPESGWNPFYLLLYNQKKLSGIMPLFLKTNSSGEFVFDWSWADAFYRHGLPYYPKLVCSIPFTPASGPRLSLINGLDRTKAIKYIIKEVKNLSDKIDISSFHILFPNNKEKREFTNSGLRLRTSNSFHWFNNKYKNFDDFLNDFTSRQRKNLKKETKAPYQKITVRFFL
jgi:hypothetical protein